MHMPFWRAVLGVMILGTFIQGGAGMSIPEDFPRFVVPGQEATLDSVRGLFWLHYPGAGPKATLWDEWLTGPSLWPAVDTTGTAASFQRAWRDTLSTRHIDPDGYVATHQHHSIAHQYGWPFPFWNQGRRGCGWHFSFKDTVGPGWRPNDLCDSKGWAFSGVRDVGIDEEGLNLELEATGATITPPAWKAHTHEVPFLQLRWRAEGLGLAQPYIEWITEKDPQFSAQRRFYFAPVETTHTVATMVPMYKHPRWTGEITGLRVGFGNPQPGGKVTLQALFSQYDTRHNVNSQSYIRGCANYFNWTGDKDFLRLNIDRMRSALRHLMTEQNGQKEKIIRTTWVGHEGRSGFVRKPDGSKEIRTGDGIGGNYWDLLPFGWKDCYATMRFYDSLRCMADIERAIIDHPEWNVDRGTLAFDPDELTTHAAEVKALGNSVFWNPTTGRFVAAIDIDGVSHDYGYTFVNLEAIYYGFADDEHARKIMDWISGDRIVADDTSTGTDIYHWRFAPRASTRRNIDYYFWCWNAPESIPFGGQVQDGGGVLGFSYHDLMSRLRVRGADDAWKRLGEIAKWFDEVQVEGGYRKYYNGSRCDGTLQGGGTAGGLGLDCEFFESVMVPQVMLDGFLGFAPTADGFAIKPDLPTSWPELHIDRIRLNGETLDVRVSTSSIEVRRSGSAPMDAQYVLVPAGNWRVRLGKAGADPQELTTPVRRQRDGAYLIPWGDKSVLRFERS